MDFVARNTTMPSVLANLWDRPVMRQRADVVTLCKSLPTIYHRSLLRLYNQLTRSDGRADMAPGSCYSGQCWGHNIFTTDGTCGYQHGNRQCIGKQGDCCNIDGTCGSGPENCGLGVCQSGNCEGVEVTVRMPMGDSLDGTCPGPNRFVCNKFYGGCCRMGRFAPCRRYNADCGVGW